MSQKRLAVGDVFAIPLGDGQFGYAQFIRNSEHQGPLLKVFDLITDEIVPLGALKDLPMRFRPVLVNFFREVKDGVWTFLGKLPVKEEDWPVMITGHVNPTTKKIGTWFLVYDEELLPKALGRYLPKGYRDLEYAVIRPASKIVERIRTGVIPDAYWLPFEDPPEGYEFIEPE